MGSELTCGIAVIFQKTAPSVCQHPVKRPTWNATAAKVCSPSFPYTRATQQKPLLVLFTRSVLARANAGIGSFLLYQMRQAQKGTLRKLTVASQC